MSLAERDRVSKQRRFRERSPDKPVLDTLADRYSEWYLGFCPTGDATRSELAEIFFENAREAAKNYIEMEGCSRSDWWGDYTRDPESRHWVHKHFDERQAWASAIDLLWQFSEGEAVDADALREALIRMSLRRHREGRRGQNEEHIFVAASGIVRENGGLDRMTDERNEKIHEDYR